MFLTQPSSEGLTTARSSRVTEQPRFWYQLSMLLVYLCNQNALQKQLKAGEIYFASRFQEVSGHHSEEDKAEYLSAGAQAVTPYIAVNQEEALVPESWARLYPSKSLFLKPWPTSKRLQSLSKQHQAENKNW